MPTLWEPGGVADGGGPVVVPVVPAQDIGDGGDDLPPLAAAAHFNRRTSRSRGLLFYRLLQQAVATDPHPYPELTTAASLDDYLWA